jgi:hypothetical protein
MHPAKSRRMKDTKVNQKPVRDMSGLIKRTEQSLYTGTGGRLGCDTVKFVNLFFVVDEKSDVASERNEREESCEERREGCHYCGAGIRYKRQHEGDKCHYGSCMTPMSN